MCSEINNEFEKSWEMSYHEHCQQQQFIENMS